MSDGCRAVSPDLAWAAGVEASPPPWPGVRVWCGPAGQSTWTNPVPSEVVGLHFEPDGQGVWASGGKNSWVLGWDTATGRRSVASRSPLRLDDVSVSPDGRFVAARPDAESEVLLLDVDRRAWHRVAGLPGRVTHLSWTGDGRAVAVGTSYELGVVDAVEMRLAVLGGRSRGTVSALAAHPDRPVILSGEDRTVRVWEWDTTIRPVNAFDWHVGWVTALAVSPDGMLAAAAGSDGTVVVWDLEG
jgi:WD40 repeat protein